MSDTEEPRYEARIYEQTTLGTVKYSPGVVDTSTLRMVSFVPIKISRTRARECANGMSREWNARSAMGFRQ